MWLRPGLGYSDDLQKSSGVHVGCQQPGLKVSHRFLHVDEPPDDGTTGEGCGVFEAAERPRRELVQASRAGRPPNYSRHAFRERNHDRD